MLPPTVLPAPHPQVVSHQPAAYEYASANRLILLLQEDRIKGIKTLLGWIGIPATSVEAAHLRRKHDEGYDKKLSGRVVTHSQRENP